MSYDFKKIEKKWQAEWEKKKVFEVKEDKKKKKFYVLDMFPYPSGEGLHIGHAFAFSLGDICARFKRLQGFNVLYPAGYDALGLPAENAAIKAGTHPKEYTKKSMANFMKQQKAMGWSYDWKRVINTSEPGFYMWDQWIFLKMFEKGLAYRKKAPVNYCKKCDTVLANEQVINGCCWRHEDTEIEIKQLEQWFLKIRDYAEELLTGLEKIDWHENAKKLQRNWIGKSYGTEIDFEIAKNPSDFGAKKSGVAPTRRQQKDFVGNGEKWPIFTTRPDTIYGVTFMVVAAQHPRLNELVTKEQKKEVEKFLKKIKYVKQEDIDQLEKEGVFTGSYAINPVNGEKVPVYAGNFVVADYGSGMVMAVPGHDQRDYEFARKYKIPLKEVISATDHEHDYEKERIAFTGEGILVNSDKFDGLKSHEAKERITKFLSSKKIGRKDVQYRLKDWLISRQRYWGTPIPIVYCDKCGVVPIPEKELPVKLPDKVKFGKGNPLMTNKNFINVKCPKCKSKVRRETDTMDTFANSSWYYLRYCDPKNEKKIFDSSKADYWCPIDQYIGGPEHITMHLIYIRFYTKFLRDIGLLDFDEPALKYFTQGIVKGTDGEKMSKSRGNVIEPFDAIKKYGADTLRLSLVSFGSSDSDFGWDEKIVFGSFKFLNQVYEYFSKLKIGKVDKVVENIFNKTLSDVSNDIENFRHNLAVIKIRKLFSFFVDKKLDKKSAERFLILLHPYCPFVTEELWKKMKFKGFISVANWPVVGRVDESLLKQSEAIDNLVSDISNILRILKQKGEKNSSVKVYVIPNEISTYQSGVAELKKRTGLNVGVFSVKDAKSEGKNIKAKPGKPGLLLE